MNFLGGASVKDIVFFVLLFVFVFVVGWQKRTIEKLENDLLVERANIAVLDAQRSMLSAEIEAQNQAISKMRIDQEVAQKELPKVLERAKEKYSPKETKNEAQELAEINRLLNSFNRP